MTDEKDDVHWITGQELREIYADNLSLDKYDEIRKRPVPAENRVPSSTELIAMANLEWKNREERRGIHNKEGWCCGWMAGFLSEKKPNWRKEQIEAAERRGYERALDDLGVLHGEDARKFNEELKNPSPLTPEAAELVRKARGLLKSLQEDICCDDVCKYSAPNCDIECPHEIALVEMHDSEIRKEMAKSVSEILDHEWMCDLKEIQYILDCVANGNADPFKDRPEKGADQK